MADNTDITTGQNIGKKISELSLLPPALSPQIANFVLPAEYGNANYRLTVFDIVSGVTKESLGLDRVNNTSDVEKPLSNFAIQEFQKYWKKTDLIPQNSVENLVENLLTKRSKSEEIPLADVSGLIFELNNKLDVGSIISVSKIIGLGELLGEKASTDHNHSLTELTGWTNYISGLQQSLSIRPTADVVSGMIETAVAGALDTDTNQFLSMNESDADWS